LQEVCDPLNGLMDYQARNLAFALGLSGEQIAAFTRLLKSLYRLFKENDLALLEINPLIVTEDGTLAALDCKMSIDDNALYRQKKLAEQRDWTQDDLKEAAAHAAGLNYIALNGNIGCMVNGAGLAMATMDMIKLHGGAPANFLDVGGGATAETVAKAFKIILADNNVKAILVNIFGGIMRCDIIAEGIMTAVKEVGIKIPVVVRLEGTNVELGRKMLSESGLSIISADGLTDAAQRVVAAAGTPKCCARDLPASRAPSIRSRRWPMARKWWAASRRARAGRRIWDCLSSTPCVRRCKRLEPMLR